MKILLIIIILIFIPGSILAWMFLSSMFRLKEEIIVASSSFEGVITKDGKPISGAEVHRWLKWEDDNGITDSSQTNSKGEFFLPAVNGLARTNPLNHFSITQVIKVFYQSKEYTIWVNSKSGKLIHDELGGVPVNFRCELTDERKYVETKRGGVGTSCKWDDVLPVAGDVQVALE